MERFQQGKKHKKDKVVIPQEWLHPREGKHINSVDSLLHHDDLVKEETSKPRREVIEGYLSKKRITRWPGRVKEIQTNWNGSILFKGYFEIRFVPQNVQPTMPGEGDLVNFCLAFDKIGLSAWWVTIERGHGPLETVKTVRTRSFKIEDDSSSDTNDDLIDENIPQTGHFESNPSCEINETGVTSAWQRYDGKRMHGVVISTEPSKGYGYLKHPDVSGKLFFHASQLVRPVISLEGNIEESKILEFQVEKLKGKMRATDIHEVKVRNFRKSLDLSNNQIKFIKECFPLLTCIQTLTTEKPYPAQFSHFDYLFSTVCFAASILRSHIDYTA